MFNLFLSLGWAGAGITALAAFLILGHYALTKNLGDEVDEEEPTSYNRYEARITRAVK
jgi:hypothetical protein